MLSLPMWGIFFLTSSQFKMLGKVRAQCRPLIDYLRENAKSHSMIALKSELIHEKLVGSLKQHLCVIFSTTNLLDVSSVTISVQ